MWGMLHSLVAVGALAVAMLLLTAVPDLSNTNNIIQHSISKWQRRRLQEASNAMLPMITILTNAKTDGFARKQRELLQQAFGDNNNNNNNNNKMIANATELQHSFLVETNACVPGAAERFDDLVRQNHSQLAEEIWKYCSLYHQGGLYLDSSQPLLKVSALQELIHTISVQSGSNNSNDQALSGIAILMDSFAPNSMHGSLLFVKDPKSTVALEMAKLLVTTDIAVLTTSPLLLPRALYDLIAKEVQQQQQQQQTNSALQHGNNGPWYLLQQSCSEDPFRKALESGPSASAAVAIDSISAVHTCSSQSGFCCMVYSGNDDKRVAILASRTPLHPVHSIALADLPQPFQITQNSGVEQQGGSGFVAEELPYLATVYGQFKAEIDGNSALGSQPRTLTFYEQMKENNCLPTTSCNKCLADKQNGATCETCRAACPCYCKMLCKDGENNVPEDQHRYQPSVIRRPKYARDPTRLIPRIVHQTWFEDLDLEKYPNMSRLARSFQTSGWEYKFYTDDQAGAFLEEHFPPQVHEAYQLLIPGAFKADLFRYCVLLIRGGVYADVDTMMGPSLDGAIPNDVGFMVGLDEPGKKIGKRMCLWNGFIASAPGHPFLATVIETAVNNILQRFTSVDVAGMHCPMPEMSVISSFSPLFIAGPCMLGSSINKVLGRHRQTQFEAGEMAQPDEALNIPGRSIFLAQNKNDMGAHRFTFLEQNLIVLSTDFPNSDDREKLDGVEHYSTTRIRFEIYGIDNVYKDSERTNGPLIRLNVE